MEESDDRALKLGSACAGNGVRAEGLPDNRLTDVGGNEEGDAAADAVALLEELIEANDDDSAHDQLGHKEDGVAAAELTDVAVHARNDVSDGLAEGDDHAEELLCSRPMLRSRQQNQLSIQSVLLDEQQATRGLGAGRSGPTIVTGG